MLNTTSTKTICTNYILWFEWFLVCVHLVSLFANGMMVLPIIRYEALHHRKEYIIIAGLAFADCFMGASKLNINLQRVILFVLGLECTTRSVFSCMISAHWLLKFTSACATLMLFVVSCDRLYAVSYPMRYFKATRGHAIKLVLLAHACAALNIVGGVVDLYGRNKMVSSLCFGSTMFSESFLAINKAIKSAASAASVIVYMFVPYMYWRDKMSRVNVRQRNTRHMAEFRRSQKKIMITLGMSSVCTLLLDSIPRILGYNFKSYLPNYKFEGVKLAKVLNMLTSINGIMNFIFCVTRHSELWYAMKSMITFKNLPANMDSWPGYKGHKLTRK